ncbi:MAG: hypothetical protein GF384_00500, partial [Elusimicrobia bacterium]|nr:hypothetical protein [Elusimicrobiota bacterium]MBD3411568.1 hypothetical protein [Elusimicrobiota bacterium]
MIFRKFKFILIFIFSIIHFLNIAPVFAQPRYHIIDPESIEDFFERKEEKSDVFDIPEKKETFDRDTWNNFRRFKETGVEYKPDQIEAYSIDITSITTTSPDADKVKRAFEVELAYESGLSIQGVKTIDLEFKQKRFKNKSTTDPDRKQQVNEFNMEQTLRVDIQGQVGRKITVDVHFDDTQDNKRDISVRYKGDPDEVVQEAAFGDITLSLPQTEFVNYNKQVFGIMADLKYRRARFMAIGSRTKGITETKVFTGSTQLEKREIRDTSYIRRKYFKPFHENINRDTIQIWRDDQIATNNEGLEQKTAVPFTPGLIPDTTGFFDELKAGVDFSYDPTINVITFRNSVNENHVIIIDYQRTDGSRLTDGYPDNVLGIILKDASNTENITREMKNFYNLNRTKIIRDNNRGNFTFQVQNPDRTVPDVLDPGGKPVPEYPQNVEVDFESGIFYFKQGLENFSPLLPFPDDVYDSNRNRYTIFVEFRYLVKTYTLRPNIVPGSERIVVDGRVLTRDVDYFIIYDIGHITFYNDDLITENSKVEVTYEYAPFGGQFGQTLVGSRLELSPIDHLFVGSSILYNFAAKPAQVPDLRSQPTSTMVWDIDGRIEDIDFGWFPFKINQMKGEFAQSIYNPNIFGKAVLESMEGIKDDTSLSLGEDFWKHASLPNLYNAASARMQFDAITWANQDVLIQDIYLPLGTRAEDIWWEEGDEQEVLVVNYDLDKSLSDEVSLVQVLSKGGLDFTDPNKLYLEVLFYDDGNGEILTFDLGEINEDADNDGLSLETEDINLNGQLDKGEDVGWRFSFPGLDDVAIEPDNGIIDTEDLDADGLLDQNEVIAGRYQITSSGQTGWRSVTLPLDIETNGKDNFTNIKQVRMTISSDGGATSRQGSIMIARVGIVGNRFRDPTITNGTAATLDIAALNNQDNPEYDSLLDHPTYKDLYPDADDRTREQAFEVSYTNFSADTVGDTVLEIADADLSDHKNLKFFVYNNDLNAKVVFVRFGNESNYFEFEINFDAGSAIGWDLYEIKLEDINNDGVADRMVYGNTDKRGQELSRPSTTIPSLKKVSRVIVGVRNVEGSGSFWVNEIFVDEAAKRVGQAASFSGDFQVPGWTTFGGSYREVDRNFRTITTAVTNQDKFEESGYVKFNRISFLPMNFSGSKVRTKTPSAIESDALGLVSVQDEGEVLTETVSGDATFSLGKWPRLSSQVSRSTKDSNKLERKDIDESIKGTFNYTNPLQTPILHLLPSSIGGSYERRNYILEYDSTTISNIDTREETDKYTGTLTVEPWKNFSIKPSYSLSKSRDVKFLTDEQANSFGLEADDQRKITNPKFLSQEIRGNVNLTILRWLRPQADYTHTIKANYDVISTTSVTTKTVDRTSNGKISVNFQPKNIWGMSSVTPIKSM